MILLISSSVEVNNIHLEHHTFGSAPEKLTECVVSIGLTSNIITIFTDCEYARDIGLYSDNMEQTKCMAEKMEVELRIPRITAAQQNRANSVADPMDLNICLPSGT
ncbi:hypothetical protein NPIL_337411 [Nephila pilipes]|uniref:Uncharacterized protein n=1 Tax=Nephila pilipes TaxID=299642 RepID=A0A8X6PXR3_NEPPI|nr:hypothetical protein NPIL_337411 [Nephila pilipes]